MSLTPDPSSSSSLCHWGSPCLSFLLSSHPDSLVHFRQQPVPGVFTGWPAKGRVHVCGSRINPNTTSYISPPPPLLHPFPLSPSLHLSLAKPLQASQLLLSKWPSFSPTSWLSFSTATLKTSSRGSPTHRHLCQHLASPPPPSTTTPTPLESE